MIELSLAKLTLLALIALIVLGPEKLPGAARTAGVLLRRVRAGWDGVRAEVARELEVADVRAPAREAVAAVENAQDEFRDAVRRMHQPIIEATATLKAASTAVASTAAEAPAIATTPAPACSIDPGH